MPALNHHTTEQLHQEGQAIHSSLQRPYEVNSEAVQDIMSKMPSWIIRRGTSLLFVIMMILFAGFYFIRYPDIITARIVISSSNPPVKIVARTGGNIQRIFVKNNEPVTKDQNTCLLENSARYEDILYLRRILDHLDTTLELTRTVKSLSLMNRLQLGELQQAYADLYQSVNQYVFFAEKNFIGQKVEQLHSQVAYQSELNSELKYKDVLLKEQLMLENKKFSVDSLLVKDKVIAPLEFDNSRKELINQQMNAAATKSGILQNRLQQTEYLKTITDLQQQHLQQQNDLQQEIREDVKRLRGQLEIWEQKYLLKSPVDGRAAFFNVWNENQYIASGEPVLMVVPPIQNYVAMGSLRVDGAGKVRAGLEALIKLSAYPAAEFGAIKGRVGNVSIVAMDSIYSMQIVLEDGLETTSHKKISSQAQLTGIAEIVTDDKNILQRLFEKIWIGMKR